MIVFFYEEEKDIKKKPVKRMHTVASGVNFGDLI